MILVDTSALAKLLVEEPDSVELRRRLPELAAGDRLAVSVIADVELRRVAIRLGLREDHAEPVLRPFRMLRLNTAILALAGRLPQRHLGTLDAIHLSTALAANAQTMITYDERLADAARAEGLAVLAPGRS